jgi:triacylglycerol lipase
MSNTAIVFVPGFFGFGSFGPASAPIIEYFKFARTVLRTELGAHTPILVHQPPPTGPLSARAASLWRRLEALFREGLDGAPIDRAHIIGHSTGGVDARLVCNPRYLWPGAPDAASRAALLARIGAVVTLSAPHRGTPLASNLSPTMALAIPGLWLGSIIASRDALTIAGHVGAIIETIEEVIVRKSTPEAELIARLADVDAQTARDIRRFLDEVVRDHRLVLDLTVAAMDDLDRAITGGDHKRLHCFVTVAPQPGRSLADVRALASDPVRRALFLLVQRLCRGTPPAMARWPVGPWILGRPAGLRADEARANDGIVPAWSQTLDGRATGLVSSDHLDVIGHYDGAGMTFMRSNSGFGDEHFDALWRRIAALLRD